jgi:hypothetical protein
MLITIRRAVLPLLLLIGGIAAIVYGVMFHNVPVLEDHESEISIQVPATFSPGRPPFPGMDMMNGPPQFVKKTVRKKSEEAIKLAEPALIRDATIGGIVLNDAGKLKRTYSGKPPALCPT